MRFLIIILTILFYFVVGFKVAQDYGLDQCKAAGWEFIEEKVFPKRAVSTHPFGEEYGQKQLNHLQANIATKCITRFK